MQRRISTTEFHGDVGSRTDTKQQRISRVMEEIDGGENERNQELTGRRLESSRTSVGGADGEVVLHERERKQRGRK
jgi:hypothetical protein